MSRSFVNCIRRLFKSPRPRPIRRSHSPRLGVEFLDDRITPAVTASFSASSGMLMIVGDAQDNVISVNRADNGQILINNGEVDVTGGTPTVSNPTTIVALGLDGNDQITLNEFNGALPQAYLLGGNGNDLLIGGSGQDYLSGGSGNDTLRGRDNNDQLFGGSGNDVLLGDRGNDQMEGQDGNDLLIWNNGDGSDFMEGGDGFDFVQVNGANGAGDDFSIDPNGERVRFRRNNLGLFTLNIGTTENLDVNGPGGSDVIIGSTGLVGLIGLDLDGGEGNDLLIGGDGVDVLRGGAGNDVLIGGRGNDVVLGQDGDDLLIVNDGDGSDLIEGGLGRDTVQVTTSESADEISISASGRVVRLEHTNVDAFFLSIGGSEVLDLRTGGGDDNVTVNDLTGVQDLQTVMVDAGDGADTVNASALQAGIAFTARGGAGNDLLLGGVGNDVLLGESGDDIILGYAGNDFVSGGDDNDILISGDGNDVLLGGDGNDTLAGGRGNDILLAGDGNDYLNGGDDTDYLDGGLGDDSAINGETMVNVP